MSGKSIEEFINSHSAREACIWDFPVGLGTQNHKLNHLSSFQQRRRLSTLCLVLFVCVCVCVLFFYVWRLMSKWKHWAILGFSFLICQLKIHFWGGGILCVLQMSFIQNLTSCDFRKLLYLFNFKRAMEVSWRSLLLEISLGISLWYGRGWVVYNIKSKVGGFFKIIESRAGAEDIKFLTINRGFQDQVLCFPRQSCSLERRHL